MKKDYKIWMGRKSKIHNDKVRPFFHEREVWFSSLGENIGFEQDGSGDKFLRPLLILRKFNNEVLWALPLTRIDKTGKYYFRISLITEEKNADDRRALLSLRKFVWLMQNVCNIKLEQLKTMSL